MEEQLIVLKTYMYPSAAYPLMSKLESEGINCFLDGENTITVHPFLSNAIGGVKLKIRESDTEAALNIIRESEAISTDEVEISEEEFPAGFRYGFVKVETFCPECDSTMVFRRKMPAWQIILAIALLPLYLPLLFAKKKHYCSECGYEWKQ